MKKKLFFMLLCLAIIHSIMPSTAYADIGPKPSVVIDFRGFEDETYYVTLLSDIASTGPHSVLGEHPNNQRYQEDDEDYEIWQKFVDYPDKDEFYFLQYFSNCSDTSQFTWGYYPPPRFKILLYFPEQERFVISEEIYERYAFDSYYIVDAKGLEMHSSILDNYITAERNYEISWELISLFARIVITIIIEVLVALLFGFRAKKQLLIIVAVNIVTQSILNILLNIINYNQGSMMFVLNYIWMEALVIMIEAVVYSSFLHKYSSTKPTKRWLVPLYALSANAISFCIGLYIAYLTPGIF